METIVFALIGLGLVLIRYYSKQQKETEERQRQNLASTPSAPRPQRGTPPMQNQRIVHAKPAQKQQKQTKIEKRREQQQAAADKSRIHQNLHAKEQQELEEKMKQEMETHPQRFAFEDSDLMAEVADIMACGYPTKNSGQRDFIAEGNAFLTRISTNNFE